MCISSGEIPRAEVPRCFWGFFFSFFFISTSRPVDSKKLFPGEDLESEYAPRASAGGPGNVTSL